MPYPSDTYAREARQKSKNLRRIAEVGLVYVNNVIKGKLLESETLCQQATNNTKEQFANSPDLKTELLNAIMGALDAHTLMSTQALNSASVQGGLKNILLNNAGLYETLRDQAVHKGLV